MKENPLSRRLFERQPLVMGILNVTPDSFSDGGQFQSLEAALRQTEAMIQGGADIIDIGGESTRPGARRPSQQEELDRVLPILDGVQARFDVPISIDSSTPEVISAAASLEVAMINDVRALTLPGAVAAVGDFAFVALMHMQGTPENMQVAPRYQDLFGEINGFFSERIQALELGGINRERLILDPGFGFGKTPDQNFELIRGLSAFSVFDRPLMIGLSRKSSLRTVTDDILSASVAGALAAVAAGASLIRVHDVGATVSALAVWKAIYDERKERDGT
ncbi:MAG: dihydropteroate synthase [Pseudomonadales bacterium]|nr:dihydropteroate synthase [Pseudomonadales bacterium]